jgi:hypothetical protein
MKKILHLFIIFCCLWVFILIGYMSFKNVNTKAIITRNCPKPDIKERDFNKNPVIVLEKGKYGR